LIFFSYFALLRLVLSCLVLFHTHTHTHTADEREEEKKKGNKIREPDETPRSRLAMEHLRSRRRPAVYAAKSACIIISAGKRSFYSRESKTRQ
jgi:hypothetical protein